MTLVLSVGVGLILGSGKTVDNVVKNSLSIFVVLQLDDSVMAMLNSIGSVKGEHNQTIRYFKKVCLDVDKPKEGGKGEQGCTVIFILFAWFGPFICSFSGWLSAL